MKKWEYVTRTPLRVSLAGGGTDVEPFASMYGASVLNFAINLFVRGYLKTSKSRYSNKPKLTLSLNKDIDEKINLHFHTEFRNYLTKVYQEYLNEDVELSLQSPVPPGSGLGASSALIVTAINTLDHLVNIKRSKKQLAEMAIECERIKLSIAGGFQDQYSAAYGGIGRYTQDNGYIKRKPIEISSNFKRELEDSILLIDLGLSRNSGRIIEDQKLKILNREKNAIEATLFQKSLVTKMESALYNEDIENVGLIIAESWESKKKFSNFMTNKSIDNLINTLKTIGSFGSKIVGAGGGGHIMTVFPMDKRNQFISKLQEKGFSQREFQLVDKGSMVWN